MEKNKTGAGRRLRVVGVIVLVLGFVSAGLVYGLSTGPEDLPDQLADPAGFKRSARQMDTVFGKTGSFSYASTEDLKDPLVQAGIIAIGSVIVAAGCFFFAELEGKAKRDGQTKT